MTADAQLQRLLHHIQEVGIDQDAQQPHPGSWSHIGAIILDACLQGGRSYRSQVRPAARDLVEAWPDASTTEGFLLRMKTQEDQESLRVRLGSPSKQKLVAMWGLAELFAREGLGTVEELRNWLSTPAARNTLLAVPGVGPKTADYLPSLVGLGGSVAVDVHIRRFFGEAGLEVTDAQMRALLINAAAQLRLAPVQLDHAIWRRYARAGVEEPDF